MNLEKTVFAKEVLLPDSPLKKLMNAGEGSDAKQPKIVKADRMVSVIYNDASDIILDEYFYDLLKKLKTKYKEKVTGRVVIRITALTSYHVILDLNYEDGRIVYE